MLMMLTKSIALLMWGLGIGIPTEARSERKSCQSMWERTENTYLEFGSFQWDLTTDPQLSAEARQKIEKRLVDEYNVFLRSHLDPGSSLWLEGVEYSIKVGDQFVFTAKKLTGSLSGYNIKKDDVFYFPEFDDTLNRQRFLRELIGDNPTRSIAIELKLLGYEETPVLLGVILKGEE